jgi:recombination protein RecT
VTAPQTAGVAVRTKEKRDQLKAKLAEFAPSYEALLPKNYPVDRLITGALVSTTANPDLLNCEQISVATSLAQIAQWGLDPGVTAFLVPFGSKCTAMIGYQGYIELICAAGARKVEAHEVREGDEFSYTYGSDARLVHQPKSKNGRITHAYCIVTLRGGVQHFEVMTAEEIDTIRQNHSKQWKRGELTYWYARKSVIRRIMKYVPKTPRLQMALHTEDLLDEAGEPSPELLGRLDESKQLPAHSGRNVNLSAYDDTPTAQLNPGAPVQAETVDMRTKPGAGAQPGDQGYSDEDLALDRRIAEEEGQ